MMRLLHVMLFAHASEAFRSSKHAAPPLTPVRIHLNNNLNSPKNNPPGFDVWVGGDYIDDPWGVEVSKNDLDVVCVIDAGTDYIPTWYYNYEWYPGPNIPGPFEDGDRVMIPDVVAGL